jgi:hypothetical protein
MSKSLKSTLRFRLYCLAIPVLGFAVLAFSCLFYFRARSTLSEQVCLFVLESRAK